MAVIHVLDKHTAELIAAGEVVERPASVVKELMENAVDAGASKISVNIERGGVALIQVADNGTGIEAEYISTAFIRHATSKIQTQKDLEQIMTLGFRGEALASIASVSRVEVLTKTELDEFACCYRIEGGEELGMEPGARPIGTTITVWDLFYNTPARMKFLKKDASEGTYVGETVTRIALSRPDVSISFIREGKQLYKTPGDGKLLSAVYEVLGREFAKDLLELEDRQGHYSVRGLITPPRNCRASRGMQFFFLNGRFVKNKTMMAALENAYRGTLMQGKFPGCVLMLDMPPDLVDVNVHPAKTEVRFARENEVFDAVYRAVKNALGAPGSAEQSFSFQTEGQKSFQCNQTKKAVSELEQVQSLPDKQPIDWGTPVRQPVLGRQDAFSGFENSVHQTKEKPKTISVEAIPQQMGFCSAPIPLDATPPEVSVKPVAPEKSVQEPINLSEKSTLVKEQNGQTEQTEQQYSWDDAEPILPLQYVGEVFKTYIITQRGQEVCLIDKHAAHERILYEKLMADYGNVSSQLLLVPVAVNLSAEEKNALLEHQVLLQQAGIQAEDFGGATVLVREVPCDVEVRDVEGLICELAQKLAQGVRNAMNEKTEWVLHSIACRAAIKAGDRSGAKELMKLAQDILDGKVPPFCPHGRPVVLVLTKKELEKQFGRLG